MICIFPYPLLRHTKKILKIGIVFNSKLWYIDGRRFAIAYVGHHFPAPVFHVP